MKTQAQEFEELWDRWKSHTTNPDFDCMRPICKDAFLAGFEIGYAQARSRSMEEAVEYAAEHLPEGWEIVIEVENGSGRVLVRGPNRTECDMYIRGTDLTEQVRAGVRQAWDLHTL